MNVGALLLHLAAFLLPALWVGLCTTLAARWRAAPARLAWWAHWGLSCAAGAAALAAGLWLSGHDGRMASYAGLVLACGTVSWALAPRGR